MNSLEVGLESLAQAVLSPRRLGNTRKERAKQEVSPRDNPTQPTPFGQRRRQAGLDSLGPFLRFLPDRTVALHLHRLCCCCCPSSTPCALLTLAVPSFPPPRCLISHFPSPISSRSLSSERRDRRPELLCRDASPPSFARASSVHHYRPLSAR